MLIQSLQLHNLRYAVSVFKWVKQLFQLKFANLLMNKLAFVRSGLKHCDKSQNLINLNSSLNSIISQLNIWWRLTESNRWPPACKAGALPTKLSPQLIIRSMYSDFLFSFMLSFDCIAGQEWRVWQDLNLWPHAYQACALTNWATDPQIHLYEEQLVVDSYRSSIFR